MCMNNSMNHGGCGCNGCSNGNKCHNLGPFLAIDAACITPQPRTSVGSIIPFASGLVLPAILTTLASGLIKTVSIVGFGAAVPGVTLVGNNIDLTSVATEAFNVPRAGTITAISASFSVLVAVNPVGTVTVRAQIYRADAGSNIFSPTTVFVDLLPSLTTFALGTFTSNTVNVTPVPVAAGDRLLMVFSATAAGTAPLANIIEGNASAGINIE
ncbi:exosporium glycoprotein BclB-related protein [Lysinibacillus xylanilyticus]|uniref:exosporium glycoprotein BclB-related protein n=1 Tax=Lysinibacillus xylanilyticus TaxID=582475 RepID=UPI003CFF4004